MEREQATKFMHDLLKLMLGKNGSDLFLTVDFPPAFNITLHGRKCLEAGDPAFPLDSTGQVEAFAEEF